MHPRHPIARLGPATSALMLTVAVASMWIGFGFSDTALVTCGVLDVYAEPVSFSEVGTWWINLKMRMTDRLRAALGLPRIGSYGSAPPQLFMSVRLRLPLLVGGEPSV